MGRQASSPRSSSLSKTIWGSLFALWHYMSYLMQMPRMSFTSYTARRQITTPFLNKPNTSSSTYYMAKIGKCTSTYRTRPDRQGHRIKWCQKFKKRRGLQTHEMCSVHNRSELLSFFFLDSVSLDPDIWIQVGKLCWFCPLRRTKATRVWKAYFLSIRIQSEMTQVLWCRTVLHQMQDCPNCNSF